MPASPQGSASFGYPVNKLLATFDGADQVEDTLLSLIDAGFRRGDLLVVARNTNAAESSHSFLSEVLHLVPSCGFQFDGKQTYEGALEAGGYVLCIHVLTIEARNEAASIVREHGARFASFYGILDIIPILP
jgi:hypothetical protein